MKCDVCQALNVDDARFCGTCGSAIERPAAASMSMSPPPSPAPPPALPPPAPPPPDPLWAATTASAPPEPTWIDSIPPGPTYSSNVSFGSPAVHHEQVTAARPAAAPDAIRTTVASGLAARRRRRRWILVGCAVVAVAAGSVLAVLALRDDSESSASTDSTAVSQGAITAVSVPVDATAAFSGTTTPVTTPSTTPSNTTVLATIGIATIAPTPISTVAPTVGPATIAPNPVVTAAPATSLPPRASLPTDGDLGLSTPITRPPCDSQYITLIGASVDPSRYATQVGTLLNQYPGAKYLKTELVCSSLRARTTDGTSIYILYFGPFATKSEACTARTSGPDDAYVKVLDNASDPTAAVNC